MSLQGPYNSGWVADSGASSHMASSDGILHSSQDPSHPTTVTVGNGSSVPVTRVGRTSLHSFKLDNVLVVPSIVTNLLSVRRFTRDNFVSIEFDPFGFSIKDLWTGTVRLRFNSSSDLYIIPPAVAARFHPNVVPTSPRALLATAPSVDLWHRRLGHPGRDVLQHLQKCSFISYNKNSTHSCHACQLGKHVRLPFGRSSTITTAPFQILHCDLWTSPLLSNSGFHYYLIIVDDYSHFYWTFPLKQKSDVFPIFQSFVSYVHTHFTSHCSVFRSTTAVSFSTPPFCPSSTAMASFSAPPVPTPPNRMVRLNVLSVLPMTSFAVFCFRPICPAPIGPRLSPLQPTFSIVVHVNPFSSPHPLSACSVFHPP